MKRPAYPPARYWEKFRKVLRLIGDETDGRSGVVAASDLLDGLMEDVDYFRAFVESEAYRPFCKFLSATRRDWRHRIKVYQTRLVVLNYIEADIRSKPWKARARTTKPARRKNPRKRPFKSGSMSK